MSEKLIQQSLKPCLAILLIVINLAVYFQTREFQFVDFDDYVYVTQNSQIHEISKESVVWTFRTGYAANWHPLTWLTHMADYHFFGAAPGGHHLVNLFIHTLNTLLLGMLLFSMTGKIWQAFSISLIFAVHPLHVESVAWVSERKDLLSTFFGFLTIYSFWLYTKRKNIWRYLLSLSMFGFSLMSKPMLVTLPFLLLLFDYWPLARLQVKGVSLRVALQRTGRAVVEKIPLFVLAICSCVVTFIVQKRGGSVSPVEVVSLWNRLTNAVEAYAIYIYKSIWPQNLAVFYPYNSFESSVCSVTAAALLLLLCTFCALKFSEKLPYVFVGWFWFAGSLIPVIGIVQVGGQSMADRYMYVPLAGLATAAVFGVSGLLKAVSFRRVFLSLILVLVSLPLALLAHRQAGYWRNSLTLFKRATLVTRENYMAHTRLGVALSAEGRVEEALKHYKYAVQVKPGYVTAHYDMAIDLVETGKIDEAVKEFEAVVRLSDHFGAHIRLGEIFSKRGRTIKAERHYLKAIEISPRKISAYNALGIMYAENGKPGKAKEILSDGVSVSPGSAETRNNLGLVCFQLKEYDIAISMLKEAVKLKQGYPEAHNNLGLALLGAGSVRQAVQHFKEAIRLKPDYENALQNLKGAGKLSP